MILVTNNSIANVLLKDDFESKNLSAPNANGLTWSPTNKTSIVTMNPECGGLPSGTPTVVYDGSVICDGPQVPAGGGAWHAKSGNCSLRFRYPAGNHMSEQRFATGATSPELWIRYWVKVPSNFTHPVGGGNNKFFAIWSDVYSETSSSTVVWEMRPTSGGSNNIYFHYNVPGSDVGSDMQYIPFINVSTDRGRWMQVVLHVKLATGVGANNGLIEFYRRWDGESSFTRLHYLDSANLYPQSGNIGFRNGYLMGWANSPYAADTEWLVDDFEISTTSLLATPSPQDPPAPGNLIISPK